MGSQVLAALAKRASLIRDPEERATMKGHLLSWLDSKGPELGKALVKEAWGPDEQDRLRLGRFKLLTMCKGWRLLTVLTLGTYILLANFRMKWLL